jgi:hypothetical protein
MDTEQLFESFQFRFAAAGVREPGRTAEELLAHVFHCPTHAVHHGIAPAPHSSGQQMAIIRQLEELATRIESGESPQDVLNCLDF